MYKILTFNNISVAGLDRFPRDRYEIASEIQRPDAIMLRSHDMHGMTLPETVQAVGRAGAGVNNIPVGELTGLGIPVFNAPGANANAVKELVLAGMLIAARNLCPAWGFAGALEGDDEAMARKAEEGKKQFVGFELPGRVVGVIGLGAIGVHVANMAVALGMRVIGYDPLITVQSAWRLSADVEQALSLDDLLARSDFVSMHVPLTAETEHMINAERLRRTRKGATLLNFARHSIVDVGAVCGALEEGHLHAYVCDFPDNKLKGRRGAVMFPHIGASTREAEENCAIMVADQLRDYLENGNIVNSVNFPEVQMPRSGAYRIAIANANVPNMVGQISTVLAEGGFNIVDMLNKSRGDVAYTLTDVDKPVPEDIIRTLASIAGVLKIRAVG